MLNNTFFKICALCDNIRHSRTGVCIKCDAGLCKTYFHVTCAQKHGLLVDPSQQVKKIKISRTRQNLIFFLNFFLEQQWSIYCLLQTAQRKAADKL